MPSTILSQRGNKSRVLSVENAKAYLEPCQISKTMLFAKTVGGFQSLTIFAKSSIFNVWQGSEYASTPQETVSSHNFLFSDFYSVYYISSGICLHGFASAVIFTVTVKIKVLTALLQIPCYLSQF